MSEQTANQILNEILAHGKVSMEQVAKLKELVDADWVVDKDEVVTLFCANQALAENDDDCLEWGDFFVASITKLLVQDMETPGEIDQQEGDWLGMLLERYGCGNASEKRLVKEIVKTTSKIEGKFAVLVGER